MLPAHPLAHLGQASSQWVGTNRRGAAALRHDVISQQNVAMIVHEHPQQLQLQIQFNWPHHAVTTSLAATCQPPGPAQLTQPTPSAHAQHMQRSFTPPRVAPCG